MKVDLHEIDLMKLIFIRSISYRSTLSRSTFVLSLEIRRRGENPSLQRKAVERKASTIPSHKLRQAEAYIN